MTVNLRVWLGDLELTDYPFLLEYSMDLGRPENVYTVINDLLADGEPVSSSRSSNRSLVLPVILEGSDFQALADAESLLVAECEKSRNTLTVDPGDGFGPVTVFDTFRAQANLVRNDNEEQAFLRRYSLEIQAMPFGRSNSETIVNAASVASTVTISDECQSTSGWSNLASAGTGFSSAVTITVDSTAGNFISGTGAIKLTPTSVARYLSGGSTIAYRVKKTGLTMDMSGGGYVIVSVRMEWPAGSTPGQLGQIYAAKVTTSGGGEQLVNMQPVEAQANGFVKYACLTPHNSTVTAIDLDIWQGRPGSPGAVGTPSAWIDAIGKSATASTPQQIRSFDVGGSMRSEGSFEVAASSGLGDTLFYTCPDLGDGFRPDLRRWQTSGTSTTDTAAVNGTYVASTSTPTFEAPAKIFRRGAHWVMLHARGNSAGPGTVTVSAVVRLSGADIGQTVSVTSQAIVLPDATTYYAIPLGSLYLPPTVVDPASGATVKFTVSSTGVGVRLDELLVFPADEAALTWVRCGEGTPSAAVTSRLFLDAPSPTSPRGGILTGNSADRSDARAIVPKSKGKHMLYPGRMLAYLLASQGSGGPGLATRYTKRWHTNAAEDG